MQQFILSTTDETKGASASIYHEANMLTPNYC